MFVGMPPIPPPRVTYREQLSEPDVTDELAAFAMSVLSAFISVVLGVFGACMRPALHARAAVGVIVLSASAGFLCQVAPSWIVAFVLLQLLLLLPVFVRRAGATTANHRATRDKKSE